MIERIQKLCDLVFRFALLLGIIALFGAGTGGPGAYYDADPTGAVSALRETWPDLFKDPTVERLAEVELENRLRLVAGDGDVFAQARSEVLLATLHRATGRPEAPDWRAQSSFLSPEQVTLVTKTANARLDSLAESLAVTEDPSILSTAKYVTMLAKPTPSTGTAPDVTVDDLMAALVDEAAREANAIERAIGRLPAGRQPEQRAALLHQRLSMERRGNTLSIWSTAMHDLGLDARVAIEAPAVAKVIAAKDLDATLARVVPELVRAVDGSDPLRAALAEAQLTMMASVLGPDRQGLVALMGALPNATLREMRREAEWRLEALANTAESVQLDPRLRRRAEELSKRVELLESAQRAPTPQVWTMADEALVRRVWEELRPGSTLNLDQDLVSLEEFARAVELISQEDREAWRTRLSEMLVEVEVRVRAGEGKAITRKAQIEDLLRLFEEVPAIKSPLPPDYQDRLRNGLSASSIHERVTNAIEAKLAVVTSTEELGARKRAHDWVFLTGQETPTPQPSPSPRSPNDGGPGPTAGPASAAPKSPGRPRPMPPGSSGLAMQRIANPQDQIGPSVPATKPKGVRFQGTLVVPPTLNLIGAGVDPRTGALYVAAAGGEAALSLGADGLTDEEVAWQLLLGVYRSVFVEEQDLLYLSIDPEDFDLSYEHQKGHDRLVTSSSRAACEPHCHNKVVTDGGIEGTYVAETLYRADVFFKRMMLGLEPTTGAPESLGMLGYDSPFETWDAVVSRYARKEISDAELRAAERKQFAQHVADSSRACRVWFDMSDMELLVGDDDTIAFGPTPVYAHSEPMRQVDDSLVPSPDGRWCPDTDAATTFINENWPVLRSRYPELAQLDYVAKLVAYFTWARQLPESGVFPDFAVLDEALEAGELEQVATPRYTSGVARELEGVDEVEVDGSSTVYWRSTPRGIELALVGEAGDRWWSELSSRLGLGQWPTACGEKIAFDTLADTMSAARCAEATGFGYAKISAWASANGWRTKEVTSVENDVSLCDDDPLFRSRLGPLPARSGSLACIVAGGSVSTTSAPPSVLYIHGGVSVGGISEHRGGLVPAAVSEAWSTPNRAGLLGYGLSHDGTNLDATGGDWTVDRQGVLATSRRDALGRLAMTWSTRVTDLEMLHGPAGWAAVATVSPQDIEERWWLDRGTCMDQVTRRGGAAPSVELCQRPSLLRRPQPLSGWNVPPLELAPPRIQDRWIVLGDPPQDKMPDADADDGEWLRNAVASFDVGLSAAAALRARVALLLSFSQRRYVDPLRSITWLAEAMLAARQPKEAGVMLDQVGSALSFDETLAVLRWESARLDGRIANPPEVTQNCREPGAMQGRSSEGCARLHASHALAATGAMREDHLRQASAFCAYAPLRRRCDELVRVTATPNDPQLACHTLTDPRARWRCAAGWVAQPAADPSLAAWRAADLHVAAGARWSEAYLERFGP